MLIGLKIFSKILFFQYLTRCNHGPKSIQAFIGTARSEVRCTAANVVVEPRELRGCAMTLIERNRPGKAERALLGRRSIHRGNPSDQQQQTGMPFIIMQQVQPDFIMLAQQSQQA
jgi:hypothetical protein